MRILIVDDHAVLRSGLRLLLHGKDGLEVVGEAGEAAEALALARRLRPELVLLDLSLPGLSGLDLLQRLRAEMPWLKVLVLTMHDDPEYLRRALEAGAAGYVIKRAADAELLAAIRAIRRGETYVYPTLAAQLVTRPPEGAAPPASPPLSQREMEVMKLLVLGHTNAEIADQLGVSVKTVETHRARLMEKLGLRTRAELVRYALSHHVV
ncbi:response regulator [Caldinitratiruptor microaerophilus]|uniref:Stage 0 sporulation protein A homolog n=1 Tax=Caldinitratiruptor microaerophilus TaxID=671077 RepID=A0AA35CIW2_9FIRM|nr:response regulator transcription factor [Caldinitratiruptor microaerophilus]BDG60045.1 DNA-binding response regulator [Caldinitratiruptor microaerophilus]